ncbi:MAG: SURF1 family protein, partial [Pseudomonadota bacterium]
MLPLLLSLGFWQVDRGAWKRQMESAYLDRLTSLPVTPGVAQAWPDFTRLKLSGHFGDEVFLVDNQVLDGQTGYWVVQSFRTQAAASPALTDPAQADENARVLLVNRGFVPAPSRREQLPEIDPVDGQVQVTGVVWPFTGLIPVLDE